jgi:hypothetical protein
MISKYIRKDWGSADYRQTYIELIRTIVANEQERGRIRAQMAVHWERIEASRHGLPGRKLDFWPYVKEKEQHALCERQIAKLDWKIKMDREILDMLRPPRKRRTVLVEGVRTKLEFAR